MATNEKVDLNKTTTATTSDGRIVHEVRPNLNNHAPSTTISHDANQNHMYPQQNQVMGYYYGGGWPSPGYNHPQQYYWNQGAMYPQQQYWQHPHPMQMQSRVQIQTPPGNRPSSLKRNPTVEYLPPKYIRMDESQKRTESAEYTKSYMAQFNTSKEGEPQPLIPTPKTPRRRPGEVILAPRTSTPKPKMMTSPQTANVPFRILPNAPNSANFSGTPMVFPGKYKMIRPPQRTDGFSQTNLTIPPMQDCVLIPKPLDPIYVLPDNYTLIEHGPNATHSGSEFFYTTPYSDEQGCGTVIAAPSGFQSLNEGTKIIFTGQNGPQQYRVVSKSAHNVHETNCHQVSKVVVCPTSATETYYGVTQGTQYYTEATVEKPKEVVTVVPKGYRILTASENKTEGVSVAAEKSAYRIVRADKNAGNGHTAERQAFQMFGQQSSAENPVADSAMTKKAVTPKVITEKVVTEKMATEKIVTEKIATEMIETEMIETEMIETESEESEKAELVDAEATQMAFVEGEVVAEWVAAEDSNHVSEETISNNKEKTSEEVGEIRDTDSEAEKPEEEYVTEIVQEDFRIVNQQEESSAGIPTAKNCEIVESGDERNGQEDLDVLVNAAVMMVNQRDGNTNNMN